MQFQQKMGKHSNVAVMVMVAGLVKDKKGIKRSVRHAIYGPECLTDLLCSDEVDPKTGAKMPSEEVDLAMHKAVHTTEAENRYACPTRGNARGCNVQF